MHYIRHRILDHTTWSFCSTMDKGLDSEVSRISFPHLHWQLSPTSHVLIPRSLSYGCMQEGIVLVKLERAEVTKRARGWAQIQNLKWPTQQAIECSHVISDQNSSSISLQYKYCKFFECPLSQQIYRLCFRIGASRFQTADRKVTTLA